MSFFFCWYESDYYYFFQYAIVGDLSFGLDIYKSYAKSSQKVVSELNSSSRNVVMEQLKYVGQKDQSAAVVSSEGGLLSCVPH